MYSCAIPDTEAASAVYRETARYTARLVVGWLSIQSSVGESNAFSCFVLNGFAFAVSFVHHREYGSTCTGCVAAG